MRPCSDDAHSTTRPGPLHVHAARAGRAAGGRSSLVRHGPSRGLRGRQRRQPRRRCTGGA